jgi:uncharacterized protein (DUF39 family)
MNTNKHMAIWQTEVVTCAGVDSMSLCAGVIWFRLSRTLVRIEVPVMGD